MQESRASKLRKWANTPPPTAVGDGTPFGAGDHTVSGSPGLISKSRKRAGIPDFDGFGYDSAGLGSDRHRRNVSVDDDVSGDLGARPGTAASREIEWVDWLDEYKKMKEAKIKAETEARKHAEEGEKEDEKEEQSAEPASSKKSDGSSGMRRDPADMARSEGMISNGKISHAHVGTPRHAPRLVC